LSTGIFSPEGKRGLWGGERRLASRREWLGTKEGGGQRKGDRREGPPKKRHDAQRRTETHEGRRSEEKEEGATRDQREGGLLRKSPLYEKVSFRNAADVVYSASARLSWEERNRGWEEGRGAGKYIKLRGEKGKHRRGSHPATERGEI